ncbi:intermembrane phospholipid transport protein YdbH family protein [Sphingomonas glacialis]|uniref:intermembrane phospholipid transport protein YdbH family protein n=1 Tax=Sphingomonas glacialis TaxID=658225 RepID=UPI001F50319F|nr:YdbH domain-containing protein [Sphingomonas glacialis]
MTDGVPSAAAVAEAAPPHRRPRYWRLAAAVLVLLVAIVATLWLARKPVAEHFIDDALAARGIPARYEIERIGLRTQRLTNLSLGDPRRPALRADWVEVDTSLGFTGASVSAIRVGPVALRATLAGGKVSFGVIDRLLPASSGKPFALPAIDLGVADGRIDLATPHGPVVVHLTGAGRLDDGFAGTLGAAAARLDFGDCRFEAVDAVLQVQIRDARPSLAGPVTLARGDCGGARVRWARADLSAMLAARLDSGQGSARLAIAALEGGGAMLRSVAGTVDFAGSASDVAGRVDLQSGNAAAAGISASRTSIVGQYRYAGGGLAFNGRAQAGGARLPAAWRAGLDPWRNAGVGTPVGPIVARAVDALRAAARSGDLDARFSTIINPGRGQVLVSRLGFAAASGARATLAGGEGLLYRWPGGVRIDSSMTVSGGGLPSAQFRLRQAGFGAPLTGRAIVAAYAAGSARLALSPIDFTATGTGVTHITTRVALSGPIGTGQVTALSLPLDARWDGGARLTLNPACAPLAFERLQTGGLDLPRSSVTLCPRDGALFRLEQGAIRGGGAIGPVRLAGRLGAAPAAVTLEHGEWLLGARRFTAAGLGVRLGTPERQTRLDVATLSGSLTAAGFAGSFDGAGGQMGAVPLLLSSAAGNWRFAANRLALDGGLMVADSAADPRFKPLAARSVALTLVGNAITATGTLFEPTKAVRIADVAIAHDLGSGAGHADLTVPGITFGPQFQPDQLTLLTYGVIANVVGTVSGAGHIRWTPQALTSDGVFRTPGTDLAAAFGPATGIAGEIHFTDLLALESAPGQVATIKTLNPGIAVNDGVVRYQLLRGTRIAVEQGRWPFARGALTLDPTVLDFGSAQERRLTFRVAGMQADEFLQQFDFKNLNATGVFDGSLPMVFDATGGRIEGGTLVVQPGGGTVAYVGELTQKDVGFWGNFAFRALKSLRYRSLEIVMNGPLAGEMITQVRFAGIGQGAGAKRNFLFDRLQKLPLVFNVKITAPFRQLIDSAQSFYDPRRLIERNLPSLLEEQSKRAAPPIQPSDSRIVP